MLAQQHWRVTSTTFPIHNNISHITDQRLCSFHSGEKKNMVLGIPAVVRVRKTKTTNVQVFELGCSVLDCCCHGDGAGDKFCTRSWQVVRVNSSYGLGCQRVFCRTVTKLGLVCDEHGGHGSGCRVHVFSCGCVVGCSHVHRHRGRGAMATGTRRTSL